ncbi:hypothetical protein [Cupriavidus sp. TMH.W2]|uniref:hypothetical protein n=1 Tax=Cupriavidus sp. TMH.W2 TaxID=3434465 RepID=UPI003D76A634
MRDKSNDYAFNGLAGCVTQRRAGAVLVGLYAAGPAGLDASDGQWATVCETHGAICNHRLRQTAERQLADPAGWCEACRGVTC